MQINGFEIKDYISTDSSTECVDGLRHISELLDTVFEYANNWRWVIFALHNTVQNFMVITLRDSSGTNILKKNIQADYYNSFRDETIKRPVEKLDYFLNLYKNTKNPDEMKKYMGSTHFVPTKRQDESIEKLNFIRNEFTHFVPKGYLAHISGMPEILDDCMDYIDFLAFKSFHLPFHRKKDEKLTKKYIEEIKEKTNNIRRIFVDLSNERIVNKNIK